MYAYLSFGRLHIPVFGIFVAAGLMAAMALSQRTARLAKVDPLALWDLGMVTVFAAFLLSRLLLVMENFRVFLEYPVLVLELPSLTWGGLAATLVVAMAYLRRRRLPVLATLDALSPCVALACAFFDFGEVADGTRDGMLTSVRWSVQNANGRVHPVEFYSGVVSLVLFGVLLVLLRTRRSEGDTVAWGMFLGGLAVFLLDFYHMPPTLFGNPLIERIQWEALAAMLAGVGMRAARMLLDAYAPKEVDHAV